MTQAEDDIKAGMRRLIIENGSPVKLEEPWWENDSQERVGIYGWRDSKAIDHVHPPRYEKDAKGCEWVVPEGAVVKEVGYDQFDGTFVGNHEEVGINAYGCHCKCGKYANVVLRVTVSLGEAVQKMLGYDPTKEMRL